MDSLNMRMGRFGVPSGAVRVFTSNPSVVSRQPLYTDERIRTRPNGRQFELDIFLRLAKITLIKNSMIHILKSEENSSTKSKQKSSEPKVIQSEEYKKLTKMNKHLTNMNNMLQQNNESLMNEKEDAISESNSLKEEMETLKSIIESHKDKINSDKYKIKELRKMLGEFRQIHPHLVKIVQEEGLGDMEHLFTYIESLRNEEQQEEIQETIDIESIYDVLQKSNQTQTDHSLSLNLDLEVASNIKHSDTPEG